MDPRPAEPAQRRRIVTDSRMLTLWLAVVGLVLLAAAAGCGDAGGETAAPPSTPTSLVATPSGSRGAAVDWSALPARPVAVEGWAVVDCEGNAPLLCIRKEGAAVGSVELSVFGRPEGRSLEAFQAGHEASLRADRAAGCPDLEWHSSGPVEATVAGLPGMRWEWSLSTAGGEVVERSVDWYAVREGELIVLHAEGLHPERGCLEALGGEFLPDVLADAVPVLDAVAARSIVPTIEEFGMLGAA